MLINYGNYYYPYWFPNQNQGRTAQNQNQDERDSPGVYPVWSHHYYDANLYADHGQAPTQAVMYFPEWNDFYAVNIPQVNAPLTRSALELGTPSATGTSSSAAFPERERHQSVLSTQSYWYIVVGKIRNMSWAACSGKRLIRASRKWHPQTESTQ
ncbi:hypothetical protein ANCCAN_01133 [Ancylostoma caninum]|uniref:Uncharacterized protein n=1 Tax=Ancylostoma caninum TaxID=29170 RepID=A0A368H861_ANCCA|nr:hypothetical protein ANCCAN_01133 [Ancylostoma caninum]